MLSIATAMTIRLWAYLFNMLWGVKTNLDIEADENERYMAKKGKKSAAGYFSLLRIFMLTSIISIIKVGYKVGYLKNTKATQTIVCVAYSGDPYGN